jgi:hypothetical protein
VQNIFKRFWYGDTYDPLDAENEEANRKIESEKHRLEEDINAFDTSQVPQRYPDTGTGNTSTTSRQTKPIPQHEGSQPGTKIDWTLIPPDNTHDDIVKQSTESPPLQPTPEPKQQATFYDPRTMQSTQPQGTKPQDYTDNPPPVPTRVNIYGEVEQFNPWSQQPVETSRPAKTVPPPVPQKTVQQQYINKVEFEGDTPNQDSYIPIPLTQRGVTQGVQALYQGTPQGRAADKTPKPEPEYKNVNVPEYEKIPPAVIPPTAPGRAPKPKPKDRQFNNPFKAGVETAQNIKTLNIKPNFGVNNGGRKTRIKNIIKKTRRQKGQKKSKTIKFPISPSKKHHKTHRLFT